MGEGVSVMGDADSELVSPLVIVVLWFVPARVSTEIVSGEGIVCCVSGIAVKYWGCVYQTADYI